MASESEYSGDDAADDLSEGELYLEELGNAVEAKVKALGTDVHPDLGPVVLKYADALLTREENNLDPLANKEEVEGEDDDLQVAWECFEQARLCFEAASDGKASSDLAFVHQRLGDLTSLQGNFDVAVTEYQAALDLLPAGDDTRIRAGILVPLAQAYMMVQNYPESKRVYLQALELLNALDSDDDIAASIAEIKQNILECDYVIDKVSGQKPPAAEQPKENTFDLPTLDPGRTVVLAPVRKKQQDSEEKDIKRQRTHH
jgi:tetratricopeptide (TPR) repeat protein